MRGHKWPYPKDILEKDKGKPPKIISRQIQNSRREWANAPFKKTIQHFAPLPKLIREMPLF